MNFEVVVKALLERFERERIRYAVIGGFAVGALGIPRTTMDLDLLVHREDLSLLDRVMKELGYRCSGRTENVSLFIHANAAWGRIDCLHAFRSYSVSMLTRAQTRPVLGGTHQLRILQVEDLIGLKVQGLANNPLRRAKEQLDIEALMSLHGTSLDWQRIQEYYDLFELGEEARRLRAQFGHAQ